jgi:hypothetical protein
VKNRSKNIHKKVKPATIYSQQFQGNNVNDLVKAFFPTGKQNAIASRTTSDLLREAA